VTGNRQQFLSKEADAKFITGEFDSNCGIDPKKESHMHRMKILFRDPNTIATRCEAMMDGREVPAKVSKLKRVKSFILSEERGRGGAVFRRRPSLSNFDPKTSVQ
jgi:hypothetical protein